MNVKNMVVIGVVVVAAAAIVFLKQGKPAAPVATTVPKVAAESVSKAMPRLVDLGAGQCIPCRAMKPILADLAANYAGVFKTEFIDVWENEAAKTQYKIDLIPTQIFFAADGKELFRHEGFFAKADILAKWKEFGVNVEGEDVNAQRATPNVQR